MGTWTSWPGVHAIKERPMKKRKLFITIGIISILILLILTGCGTDTLKAFQQSAQKESSSVSGSSEEHSEESPPLDSADSDSHAEPTENPETNCSTLNPHPMAEGMAEQFEASYDEIMTWYCDGAAFSDILLALETEELVDLSVEELLVMVEESTWEEIWEDLGVNPEID
jgi:hypothetical protein